MGVNFTGEAYVRRSGKRIFVSSDGSHNPCTAFTPSEARAVAGRLFAEADAAEGKPLALVLTLTTDEAEALASVLHRVGGDPHASPRGKTQAIYNRLKASGVTLPPFKFEVIAGGLWFKNYDGKGIDPLSREWADVLYAYMGPDL